MRYIKYNILFLIIFVVCIVVAGLSALGSLPKLLDAGDAALQERIAVSDTAVVYVLPSDGWLEFELPAGIENVRIISNASIPSELLLVSNPTDSWQYSLNYQIVDKNGDLLLENIYHQRAGLNKFKDPHLDEYFTSVFYLDDKLTPVNGQVIILNLQDRPTTDKLRIKLASVVSPVEDVVVRVYSLKEVPESKLKMRWQRMSNKKKENLAKGNVYSFDMLTAHERRSLLSEIRSPLGPSGIESFTYQSRTLYSMNVEQGQKTVHQPIPSSGVLVDANYRGVIPIPENGGKIQLHFDRAWADHMENAQSVIRLQWYGRKVTERVSYEIPWRGKSTQFEQIFAGGLLEISSIENIAVRAYLTQPDESNNVSQLTEITPEITYQRGYLLHDETPVEYKIVHIGVDATPFRVDFRHMASFADKNMGDQQLINYFLMDAQDNVIKQGQISLFAETSQYDRVAGDINDTFLSDPVSYFFSLPTNVAKVRIVSEYPVLVFAYNRPANLAREIKVPESAYVSDFSDWSQPAWFLIRPIGYQNLILDNRSILLTIQQRPPEDKPDLLAGDYLWEDYRPEGNWLARNLFVPIEDVGLVREEAFPLVYRKLALGQVEKIYFQAAHGRKNVTPYLAYFRQDDSPFELSLFVDGHLHFKTWVNGQQGDIQLPVLTAGGHNIKVVMSSPANIYVSHTKPVNGSLLKRLVNQFDYKGLSFEYQRASLDEEILSARLYVPYGTNTRSKVRVHIENIMPLPLVPLQGWSFDLRSYDVRPDMTSSVSVMGTNLAHVDQGQSFFIPLGEALPLGRYRINFKLEQGPGGYLSLAKITPGIFQEQKISYETEIASDLHAK